MIAAVPVKCAAAGLEKPLETEPCTGSECPSKYRYEANPWSGCSEKCMRSRTLDCVLSKSGVAVERARCDEAGTSKPRDSERCTPKQCTDGLPDYVPVDSVGGGSMVTPALATALLAVCAAAAAAY